MSGGKVAHELIDKMVKLEAKLVGKHNELAKAHNALLTTQQELITKHNEMGAGIHALEQLVNQVAGFTASELGKFQGTSEQHIKQLARSLSGMDINLLALAEIAKEIIGQLTQVDSIFKKTHSATKNLLSNMFGALNDDGQAKMMTPEMIEEFKTALELSETEIATVRVEAEAWYKRLVASSITKVHDQIDAHDKAAAELEAKQKAEAEAAALQAEEAEKAKGEKETVEAELRAASEAERSIVTNKSGGPGSAFPDGSDIFGG